MIFSIGVELPDSNNAAFGISVPALDIDGYGCVSASDTEIGIERSATDAIFSILLCMVEDGFDVRCIQDKGPDFYRAKREYAFCAKWLEVDVDLQTTLNG